MRVYLTILLLMLGLAAASPTHAQIRPPELDVQFHRAETAWRSGASMLEAKARIDRVLAALPDDVEALKLRTQVLLEMDRPAEALRDARRATVLAPRDAEAHLLVCESARRSDAPELAARALQEAAALVSDDAGLHVRLSWNAVLLGRLEEAESFARVALMAEPDGAAGRYQLARVFVLRQQPQAAVTLLAEGLRAELLDPIVIRADTVLVKVADEPGLRDLLDR